MTVEIVKTELRPVKFRVACHACSATLEFVRDDETEIYPDLRIKGIICPACGEKIISDRAEGVEFK